MNKFSKLLVTAAILPGMVSIPTVIADTTILESVTDVKEVVSHDNAENQKKVVLAEPKDSDSIDEWMPDQQLQQFVANHLQINVSEITKERLQASELMFATFSDGFSFLKFDSYQGLEYFNRVVMNLKVRSQEDVNFFNTNPIDWEKLSHVNETTMITLYGYLRPMFPNGIDMANEAIVFDPHNRYTPVNLKLNSSNYKSFFVSYKELGFDNASGRVQLSVVSGLATSDGTPIEYQTTQVADGVEFTLDSDIDYSELEGLTIYSVSPEEGGPYDYSPGPIIQSVFTSDVNGNSMRNYINTPINITFAKAAADVTVKHVEKVTGKELPGSYLLSGNVGDAIKSDPLEFDGYTFLETEWPTEATTEDGSPAFTENPQIVTHYYTKNPVKAADVTVDHVDEAGNKLVESEVKHGYIGDSYETQAKDIDGYTLKEVKGNAKGTHTDQPQNVTYVYSKNASDTIVPPVSDDNNQSGSTIMSPVNKNEVTDSIISTKDTPEVVATSPAESHATIILTEQTNSQTELPETHADHKVTLTVVGLLTALVIGMTSLIRPKKNQ